MSKRNIVLILALAVLIALFAVKYVPRISETGREKELEALREARDQTEGGVRMEKLQAFLEQYPRGEYRGYAYGYIFDTYVSFLEDTSHAVAYARDVLASEEPVDTKGRLYYQLFAFWVKTANSDSIAALGAEVLALSLTDPWVYLGMGYDLVEAEQNPELAVKLCDKALALAEDEYDKTYSLATLGMAHLKAGNAEEAVAALEQANQLTGEDPDAEILKYLGEAQVELGRQDDAIETYLVMMETGEYGEIRSKLVELYTETRGSAEGLEEEIRVRRERRMSPAPEFSLRSLDGAMVSLADYKGKVLLLNFTSPT
ncbi:MAG: tetratricopeptide repeat protein [Candidatus Eiseniibacteriota bacterium]|nr:MAG: tetratricopeptide repeat protein [Candidatus Eisenbacteria bacterium]